MRSRGCTFAWSSECRVSPSHKAGIFPAPCSPPLHPRTQTSPPSENPQACQEDSSCARCASDISTLDRSVCCTFTELRLSCVVWYAYARMLVKHDALVHAFCGLCCCPHTDVLCLRKHEDPYHTQVTWLLLPQALGVLHLLASTQRLAWNCLFWYPSSRVALAKSVCTLNCTLVHVHAYCTHRHETQTKPRCVLIQLARPVMKVVFTV